ncbi:peptidylprolyl isomerase [Nitrospirillum iridis]|uniref:Parvulin-like PPIase n=1 Tax=Nitrospirillum iridis TaxID=765888 RepID=A0A7X0AVE8_9PROT|nr:peptidylprolyl isomerase [Nitrospirillum iridis]MBB6250412.1 peptidyl-prolyl cis-trans isomerase D [Nitrospirillum iridis]
MLQFIRKFSGSWFSKILFVFLIISFGIWGVGRVGTTVSDQAVARVGSTEITPQDVDRAFRQQVSRLRQSMPELTAEQARQMGLMRAALQDEIQRALIKQATHDFGLRVSEQAAAQKIADMPVFKDKSGQFDPLMMRALLRQNQLTEEEIVGEVREDMARTEVTEALAAGVRVPQLLAREVVRYRGEQRGAETLLVADKAMPDPGMPDQAALEAFHKDQAARYTAPEYRALTVVTLSTEAIAKAVEVGDEDLKKAYDARAKEFVKPERRDLDQVLVDTQEEADKVVKAAAGGKSLADAAKAANVTMLPLADIAKADLPAELQETAFSLPQGKVSAPVHSGFGWHVIAVTKIVPGSTQTLDEVKAKLVEQVKAERATDQLYDLSNKLDDAISGGASLEEAAKKVDATVTKVAAVDREGKDPAGKPVTDVPALQKVVQTAFGLASGDTSSTTEGERNKSYFAVRVDSVQAPALKPLDQVKDQVVADWKSSKRAEAAKAKAKDIADKLKAGAAPEQLAKDSGAVYKRQPPVGRTPPKDSPLPADLVDALFTLKPGEVTSGAVPDGQMVVRLAAVVPMPEPLLAERAGIAARQLREGVAGDLYVQFLDALRGRYRITENRTLLQRLEHQE